MAGPAFGAADAGGKEVEGGEFVGVFLVDVAEGEEVVEAILAPVVEATVGDFFIGVLIGAEEDVPEGDVGVVVGVVVALVMDAVGLGSLEEGAEPDGGFDIPVVEKFGDSGGEGDEGGGLDGAAEEGVNDGGAEEGVEGDLDGVFVEGHEDFHAPGRVVELVAEAPEEFGFVAEAVPPVVDKGDGNVADEDLKREGEVGAKSPRCSER